MAVRIILSFCLGFTALFFGCSSDPKSQNFSYLRSPAYFKASIAQNEHEFCKNFEGIFSSEAECNHTKKYRLSWLRPEDTTKFHGYRIYVDTLPVDSLLKTKKPWDYVRSHPELANIIVDNIGLTDSLIFVFGNKEKTFQQDTLYKDTKKIFVIDTLNRLEKESGRLVFALVPVYGGDVTPGQPQLSWFIINDKFAPDIFNPFIKPLDHKISLAWARPTDPTSFFDAGADTGLIRNYQLKVTLGGRLTPERKRGFQPKVEFFQGGKDVSNTIRESVVIDPKDSLPVIHNYFLPDSSRAHKTLLTLRDSLSAVISNLTPRDTLSIQLWAVDSMGNSNQAATPIVIVHLTDTTQPSPPKISVDKEKINPNGFVIEWTASRDSLELDGALISGPNPNYLIEEYRLRRTMLRDSGEKASLLDRIDTVIHIVSSNESSNVFVDTMRFLPPGRAFKLSLTAVDITGFESLAETLTVVTPPVQFKDADSALACPKGFIPIPRGRFTLGESGLGSQGDEAPSKAIRMEPYCIEPYEHRDALGGFAANVSWLQADSSCRALDTGYNTQLCSEAEWERACEGPGIGPDSALSHGIQSEQKKPSILQSTCNQGTNDSVMARSFDLRSGTCLTKEGVYDLAGNLSEWVRDPYSEKAYASLALRDSLDHGFTFADSLTVHGFRGGNYLKPPNLPLSSIQNLARCSNRDFAQQIRPVFRKDCLDSIGPKIVVIYSSGLDGHFCMDIPESARGGIITDLVPALKDSTKILAFISGASQPIRIDIKMPDGDTTFLRKKPQSVRLTLPSLAVVTFIKPGNNSVILDTLDASEMRDSSQINLGKIFAREAGNSGWMAKQENGKFSIRRLYAYSVTGTKTAKPYYSSRAIGYRCCSLAKAPLKIDSIPPILP
jgi:hypothetical protein